MAEKPIRADKAAAVAELTEKFRTSEATVLTEYRGLTVKQLTELRRALGDTATYQVTKNTLAKRAAAAAGIEGLDDLFTGPTALAFVTGDVVEAAPPELKTLTEVLDWHVREHGDRVHVTLWQDIGAETKLTYRELAERSRVAARDLIRAGLKPGERVAIMLPTGFEFFAALFGVLYAGGVPVPIYPPARPSQLEEHLNRQAGILRNAGAAFLIAPPAASARGTGWP